MKLKKGSFQIKEYKSGELLIEVRDELAKQTFCRIRTTPAALFKAMSNKNIFVTSQISVESLDKVGKIEETKIFEFQIPVCSWVVREKVAIKNAIKACPEGWVPDLEFDKADSFFHIAKKGKNKHYARTTIRRWT